MGRPRKLPEGLRLRGKSYHADFYAGGRRIRKRLSGNLDAAVEILNDLKARADRSNFELLDNDFPLQELQAQYTKHCRQTRKPRTTQRYESALDTILPRLGANRVSQLAVDNLLAYRQDRLDAGTSPRTVNLEVGALLTMLRWGVTHSLIGSNPLAKLKPLAHDHPREGRPLSLGEVQRLLESSQEPWRSIWYCLLATGMRFGELQELRFSDLEWESREIAVRADVAKNHRLRRVPMDDRLHGILSRLLAEREPRVPGRGNDERLDALVKARFTKDHVFVTTQNTSLRHRGLYRAFLACCKKAKIEVRTLGPDGRELEHVDLHSLRRTFATSLITSGADPETVRQLLGHRTLEMTMKIYTKINCQTKRQALDRLPYGNGSRDPEHVLSLGATQDYPQAQDLTGSAHVGTVTA